MSSGPNQHFLPRFLQKPFGILPKRKEIWIFARDTEPEAKRIKHVGAGDFFYSEPAADGARTLDDEITDIETPISRMLADIRAAPIGAQINSANAAEVLNHLIPRTAHVRVSIERGLRMMARGVETIIGDSDHLQALIGLDEDEPNEAFRENLAEKLDEIEGLAGLGLPRDLIQRISFVLAKENFATMAADFLPVFRGVLSKWLDTAGTVVRESHNEALGRLSGPTPRFKLLEELSWTIAAGPGEGAILPDCAALAVDHAGDTAPAMFVDWQELSAIILPVAPDKLLVGTASNAGSLELTDFNLEAARGSHDFFLAPVCNEVFKSLHARLGERSTSLIEEGVSGAMEPYLAMRPKPRDEDEPLPPLDLVGNAEGPWQYDLSLLGFGDDDRTQELITAVKGIVESLAEAIPLHRLDGITIAADYRAAVDSLDRGYEGASAPETAPDEIGQGIARTVAVFKEGRWKERIVIDGGAALALLSEDSSTVEWGLYILVRQLSEVATTDMLDRSLPGVWMTPIEDPLQGFLYTSLHPAVVGYLGSHFSAGFGDPPDQADVKRELFNTALREMKSAGLAARLDYRYHGDVDRLLAVVMPRVSYALQFGADLLGHCAASGTDPFDFEGELARALGDTGLQNWFPIFRDRLERLRVRLGRWESFNEFLALNVHVERLLWQLGILPWESPDGFRVEVPLGTDIAALLGAEENERK